MIERGLAGRESVEELVDCDVRSGTEITESPLSLGRTQEEQELLLGLISSIFSEEA